jgi:hypothetical protein
MLVNNPKGEASKMSERRAGRVFLVAIGIAVLGCIFVAWSLMPGHRTKPTASADQVQTSGAIAGANRPAGLPARPMAALPRFTTDNATDPDAPAVRPKPPIPPAGLIKNPPLIQTPDLAKGYGVVDMAIGSKAWTDDFRAQLRSVLPSLDRVQRRAVLMKLATALRQKTITLSTTDGEAI